ncbi:hypothetical protein [Microbacterium atlanticum]|uniref:hypothetical protein n=1 Tax=Microbacterium atlanticum TaxID=2782168 RepID=UPI001888B3ED|nr:hypothetical protein [Microbacterium atlanticum]
MRDHAEPAQHEYPLPPRTTTRKRGLAWLLALLAGVVAAVVVVGGLVAIPRDSDGDGLSDAVEESGWRTSGGTVYVTDSHYADTDGDGLDDSEEAGEAVSESPGRTIYAGISDPTKSDSDDDGLEDRTEVEGWRTTKGVLYLTEPMNPDTDGDGVTDAEEAGGVLLEAGSAGYEAISSPLVADSDGDGLTDFDEYDLGTDSWARDTDGDGRSDFSEVTAYDTDPRALDSDGDGYNDDYEISHAADAYDPLEPAIPPDPARLAEDFYVGAVLGAWDERDSVAWLAGNVTQGGTIVVPGVGEAIGAVGDFRDSLAQALRGDYADATLSALGLVPVIGLTAITPKVVKFVKRLPELRVQVDKWVGSIDVPYSWQLTLRKAVWGSNWDNLTSRGFTDADLTRMGPTRRANLMEEVQQRPSSIGSRQAAITGDTRNEIGRNAELAHAAKLDAEGAENVKVQVTVDVPDSCTAACGPRPTRKFDVCSGGATELSCAEVKAGYAPWSTHIREEIARDVESLKSGKIKSVAYHFYVSEKSGTVGADPQVLERLRENGIPYEIHPPN